MQVTEELGVDWNVLESATQLLTAMDNEGRQKIIRLIHEDGEMSRLELHRKMVMESTMVAYHLAVLLDQEILFSEKRGRFTYYTVNYDKVNEVHEMSAQLLN